MLYSTDFQVEINEMVHVFKSIININNDIIFVHEAGGKFTNNKNKYKCQYQIK